MVSLGACLLASPNFDPQLSCTPRWVRSTTKTWMVPPVRHTTSRKLNLAGNGAVPRTVSLFSSCTV